MASCNYVAQCGNIVKDPELGFTNGGTPVLNFRLAVNTYSNKQEYTVFIDCVVFGAFAEILAARTSKGTNIFITGELRQDEWEDKENTKHSKYFIKIDRAQVMSSTSENEVW
jgi:single-strand DNA-binding protein